MLLGHSASQATGNGEAQIKRKGFRTVKASPWMLHNFSCETGTNICLSHLRTSCPLVSGLVNFK